MRSILPTLLVLLATSCASDRCATEVVTPAAPISAAPSPPDGGAEPVRRKPTAVTDGAPRCVHPPAGMGCEFSDECTRFAERINGERAEAFWSGFASVCSCSKLPESAVSAATVVHELGEDWKMVMAECNDGVHGLEPSTYLRESVGRAMPSLAERPSQVRPLEEFFTRYIRYLGNDRSGVAFATRLRARLGELRGARWVYFADVPSDGGAPNVTSYLVGFTRSGYLTGIYTDGERW